MEEIGNTGLVSDKSITREENKFLRGESSAEENQRMNERAKWILDRADEIMRDPDYNDDLIQYLIEENEGHRIFSLRKANRSTALKEISLLNIALLGVAIRLATSEANRRF